MEKRTIFCDKIHGVLDYGVAVIFVVAPSQIDIVGPSAQLCYALAAAQLLMTLFSAMPLGVRKLIPMRVHSFAEVMTSVMLLALGWLFPGLFESGQVFFTLMGAILFFVWLASDYGDQQVPVRV